MKVKTHRHVTHTLETDEGEVKLEFAPYYENDIFVERVGDKLIVAYLVADSDSMNPLEDHDCQGNIYQRVDRNAYLYDLSEVLMALQLEDQGVPNPDVVFGIDHDDGNGKLMLSLRRHAAKIYITANNGNALALEWMMESGGMVSSEDRADEDLMVKHYDNIYEDLESGHFKQSEIAEEEIRIYKKHWRAIVGPYVVPLSYCSSNHGPGTMTVSPTSWDGDPDDLPDGVWVADKGAMENIEYPAGNHETTLAERAVAYAKSVCSEYESYCNGDVYGCVCEVFVTEGGEWEKVVDEDLEQSCWSFIGHDYAIESLKSEFFDPAVEAAKK